MRRKTLIFSKIIVRLKTARSLVCKRAVVNCLGARDRRDSLEGDFRRIFYKSRQMKTAETEHSSYPEHISTELSSVCSELSTLDSINPL